MRRRPHSLIRFLDRGGVERWGEPLLRGSTAIDSAYVVERDPADPYAGVALTDHVKTVDRILPPIFEPPPAIYCVGLNYRKHAEETGMRIPRYPVVFMKNPSAVCVMRDDIVVPKVASTDIIDFEVELAVILSKQAKDVQPEHALDYVFGYTSGNDVSARRWQGKKGGGQWTKSKSFDTFNPLGPTIILSHACENPNEMNLSTRVNGTTMQSSNTRDMIFPVEEIVSFLSQGTTLLPGTVIMTGTPEGVGYTRDPPIGLKDGDTVSVKIGDSPELTNRVVFENSAS